MIVGKVESRIWKKAFDETYKNRYQYYYTLLKAEGADECEARCIAHDNARLEAKDMAASELSEYRAEMY
jgi:hypothetical protein